MTTDDPPVLLAVDDDEKILETYEIWFGSEYELRTASSGQEALEQLDEAVQVVLLDRLMPGLSGDEVLERIRERGVDCQVAMVTAVEPDFDIAEMPFDTYVTKALDRETVTNTVERLLARAEYDDLLHEHYAIAEKLSTLEATKTESELAMSEAYQELTERFEKLNDELDDQAKNFDREDFAQSIDAADTHQLSTDDQVDSQDSNSPTNGGGTRD